MNGGTPLTVTHTFSTPSSGLFSGTAAIISDAMWACYRRSLEVGDHDSNVGPGRFAVPESKIILRTDSDDDDK
jgi:hypothetical protein